MFKNKVILNYYFCFDFLYNNFNNIKKFIFSDLLDLVICDFDFYFIINSLGIVDINHVYICSIHDHYSMFFNHLAFRFFDIYICEYFNFY